MASFSPTYQPANQFARNLFVENEATYKLFVIPGDRVSTGTSTASTASTATVGVKEGILLAVTRGSITSISIRPKRFTGTAGRSAIPTRAVSTDWLEPTHGMVARRNDCRTGHTP